VGVGRRKKDDDIEMGKLRKKAKIAVAACGSFEFGCLFVEQQ
jgi:hypothetical protein